MRGIIFILLCLAVAYSCSYKIPNYLDARVMKMERRG